MNEIGEIVNNKNKRVNKQTRNYKKQQKSISNWYNHHKTCNSAFMCAQHILYINVKSWYRFLISILSIYRVSTSHHKVNSWLNLYWFTFILSMRWKCFTLIKSNLIEVDNKEKRMWQTELKIYIREIEISKIR